MWRHVKCEGVCMCELELDKEMVSLRSWNTLWPFTHHLYARTCTSLPLSLGGDNPFEVSWKEFHSKKLVNKLLQQIHDPLVVASGVLPDWCHTLTSTYLFLFPFEVREVFFACTAFGTSWCVCVWVMHVVWCVRTCTRIIFICVTWSHDSENSHHKWI